MLRSILFLFALQPSPRRMADHIALTGAPGSGPNGPNRLANRFGLRLSTGLVVTAHGGRRRPRHELGEDEASLIEGDAGDHGDHDACE